MPLLELALCSLRAVTNRQSTMFRTLSQSLRTFPRRNRVGSPHLSSLQVGIDYHSRRMASSGSEGRTASTRPAKLAEPRVCRTLEDFRCTRRSLSHGSSIGFVPTMGALHEGHLDLFRRARSECDVVIGSIFVNPAQFGPNEDFDRYPRQLERDLELLAAEGLVDVVFAPSRNEMYPPSHRLYVDPMGFDELAEGLARPGFFRGVATILVKLFNTVQPDYTYFGEKDALQCVLVKKLVEDLNVPVEVVIVETRREADGLAMSSRNAYLSPEERSAAPVVFHALQAAAEARQRAVMAGRHATREELVREAEAMLSREPLVTSIEYLSIGCRATMEELEEVGDAGAVISVALRLGSVRLIDNVTLPPL